MRHSKKFNELLLQYEATPLSSGHKSEIFRRMMKAARTFSDWASIYQYAGSSIRKDAQREMEAKVLRGKSLSDIRLNILELFQIIDKSDKDEILSRYLKKHHRNDDIAFARCCNDDLDFDGYDDLDFDGYDDFDFDGYDDLDFDASQLLKNSTFKPGCGNLHKGRKD